MLPPVAPVLPPDVQHLAQLHRNRQQQLAAAAVREARRRWGLVDATHATSTWQTIATVLLRLITGYQAEAARGADSYVATALSLAGATPDPAGQVATTALAGVASDGRDLAGLLGYPAFEVSAFVDGGMDHSQALAIGRRHLERIVQTQVQDAARVASGVALANDRTARGYIRLLTPPSCSRCAVLAGRWYEWNAGFERHPLCDCVHIPAAEDVAGDVRTAPRRYFDSLDEAEQNRVFTRAGAQAIRDGADPAQVVNARRGARGLTPAGARITAAEARTLRGGRQRGHLERTDVFGRQLYTTTEGSTTRGLAGQRLGARETGRKGSGRYRRAKAPRLMPESIYEIAGGDRDEALRLLERFGYITGG